MTRGIVIPGKGKISPIVISTALGTTGGGIFPYTLMPSYRRLLEMVKGYETTVFTKSLTRFPRVGNFILGRPWTWKFIQNFGKGGMLNAYGLTNSGVFPSVLKVGGVIDQGVSVIPNLFPEFDKGEEVATMETLDAIDLFGRLEAKFWAVEINISCPNSGEEISKNMAMSAKCISAIKMKYPHLVVIAKISVVHEGYFPEMLEQVGVDVVHAFNTVPFDVLHSGKGIVSPLAKVGGGGVSGAPAYAFVKKRLQALRSETSLPIIMGCGVSDSEDIDELFNLGANAVTMCTAALRNPDMVRAMIPIHNTLKV